MYKHYQLFQIIFVPIFLKMADVTPLHKNGKKGLKENYRLVTEADTRGVL